MKHRIDDVTTLNSRDESAELWSIGTDFIERLERVAEPDTLSQASPMREFSLGCLLSQTILSAMALRTPKAEHLLAFTAGVNAGFTAGLYQAVGDGAGALVIAQAVAGAHEGERRAQTMFKPKGTA